MSNKLYKKEYSCTNLDLDTFNDYEKTFTEFLRHKEGMVMVVDNSPSIGRVRMAYRFEDTIIDYKSYHERFSHRGNFSIKVEGDTQQNVKEVCSLIEDLKPSQLEMLVSP